MNDQVSKNYGTISRVFNFAPRDYINYDEYNLSLEEIQSLAKHLGTCDFAVKELRLRENKLGVAECRVLSTLYNVEYLDLGNNSITNPGAMAILRNPRITRVSFANNLLTDECIPEIQNATHVAFINVIGNRFSSRGLQRIKQTFS